MHAGSPDAPEGKGHMGWNTQYTAGSLQHSDSEIGSRISSTLSDQPLQDHASLQSDVRAPAGAKPGLPVVPLLSSEQMHRARLEQQRSMIAYSMQVLISFCPFHCVLPGAVG